MYVAEFTLHVKPGHYAEVARANIARLLARSELKV